MRYTERQKREAVENVLLGQSSSSVAEGLGADLRTVRGWVMEHRMKEAETASHLARERQTAGANAQLKRLEEDAAARSEETARVLSRDRNGMLVSQVSTTPARREDLGEHAIAAFEVCAANIKPLSREMRERVLGALGILFQ